MGDPKKFRKHFKGPKKRWDKIRIEREKEIKKNYGLKNKKELWRMEAILKNKRENARTLLALSLNQRVKREKELLDGLKKYGLVKENAILDDVLSLTIEEILERRLQTIVMRKNLANTPKQARQFIVHGHIAIEKQKFTTPSYLVPLIEEEKIAYAKKELYLATKVDKSKKPEKNESQIKKEFEEMLPQDAKQVEKAKQPENETLKTVEEPKIVEEKIKEVSN